MTHKIDKKIVGYKVLTDKDKPVEEFIKDHMHEGIKRPEVLKANVYKIKTNDHALYITISDMILNEGTEHEERRPYEVFINSKNMENFQWIVALTRLVSAVFRKGGEVAFLVEELKAVFDPKGGYFKRGTYMPSLVAEIGHVIETHLYEIGFLKREVDPHMEEYLAKKREEHGVKEQGDLFPEHATFCDKCNTKAMIMMDGCQTCLSCGASKCN